MKPIISKAMGWIVPKIIFYEDKYGIKLPTNVDMTLNKETKLNIDRNMCTATWFKVFLSNSNNFQTNLFDHIVGALKGWFIDFNGMSTCYFMPSG